MVTYVGIDQSFTSTGLVAIPEDTVYGFGAYPANHHGDAVVLALPTYLVIRTESDKEDPLQKFKRAASICAQVIDFIAQYNEPAVTIEGLGFAARGDATRDLGGLQYLIVSRLIERGISPTILAPTSLKKRFTGNGKASKKEMVEAVKASCVGFHGVLSETPGTKGKYDLADAYALAFTTATGQSDGV